MQTSITTWFKKSAAVKQSTAPLTLPNQASLSPQSTLHTQHAATSPSLPQQQTPQPTLNTPHPTIATPKPLFTHPQSNLPKNITLVPCDKSLLQSFERLNTLLLPIPYPSTFYKEILSDAMAADLTLLATWQDNCTSSPKVIAGIRCRILPDPASSNQKILYISTLGVLSAFRGYGVATALLETLIQKGINGYGVVAVGAHVWEASTEARDWYAKRGFRETCLEGHYYRRLSPQGAYVLRREIGPRDLLGCART